MWCTVSLTRLPRLTYPADAHLLLAATRLGFADYEAAGFRRATLPVFDAPALLSAIVAAGD